MTALREITATCPPGSVPGVVLDCLQAANRTAANRQPRAGFTLLELLLALSLSVVLLLLLAGSVHVFLGASETGMESVEEAVLARSVLKTLADDLRSAVVARQVDLQAGWETLSNQTGGRTSPQSGDSDAEGDSSSGNSEGGAGGAGRDNGGSGEATSSGGSGQSAGTGGGGSRLGRSGGSGDTGGGPSGSSGTSDPETDPATGLEIESQNVQPGLYGTSEELQIDTVTVLPPGLLTILSRSVSVGAVSESTAAAATDRTAAATSGSLNASIAGIVTHVYLVDEVSRVGQTALPESAGRRGLVRRYFSRDLTRFSDSGASTIATSEEMLALEVESIGFRYSDGVQWLDYWDSSLQKGLPAMVEIAISMRTVQAAVDTSGSNAGSGATAGRPATVYRLTVDLPAAPRLSASASSGESAEQVP